MKLYDLPFSPNCRKVRAVAYEVGIDISFSAAVEPLRGALRLHCYRMLGSSHDSDDMVQETMLRAWRARDTLEDPARLRPWLYRIATNACLDELARRPRRVLASQLRTAADPAAAAAEPLDEALWLEPMPDTWLTAAAEPDRQRPARLRIPARRHGASDRGRRAPRRADRGDAPLHAAGAAAAVRLDIARERHLGGNIEQHVGDRRERIVAIGDVPAPAAAELRQ